ncbi:MAG: LacI family DNA-binding transcriptional regulator [Armatimonadaceae bacterium]
MKKRTTIRDVAAHAGVSPATVSNLLNGKRRFGLDTQARIYAAMEELHFTPNGLIRALQNRRTNVIGLLIGGMASLGSAVPDATTQPLLAGIYRGADMALQDILLYTGWPQRPARSSGQDFLDGRVDGLIWLAPEQNLAALERLAAANLPVVAILSRRVPENIGFVDTDNVAGMAAIVRHLIEQGHRRIAYAGPKHASNFIDRYEGYCQALEEAGIPYAPELEFTDNRLRTGEPDVYGEALDRWRSLAEPPTAVVVSTDNWAWAMSEAMAERGIRVPEDMALTGFDDAPLARTLCGGLTTMRQPFYEIGERAVVHLLRLIEGASPSECRETLPVSLMVRNSTRTLVS